MQSSIWLHAVHGRNPEIISFLEEKKILPNNDNKQIFKESIKCHHIDVMNYIQNNYLKDENESSYNNLDDCLKYYNLFAMKFDIKDEYLFYNICKYDYNLLAQILFKETNHNINGIKNHIFQ